jgi:hypothetical protein
MNAVDKTTQTQLANIEKKTGKTLAQLHAALADSGRTKHGELRTWAMEVFGIGHGDANTLVHSVQAKPAAAGGDVLAEIYADKKAHLRPIHDKIMDAMKDWGEFEIAPKKCYVSFRRKKQFAMLGPKTNDRVELGLNLKDDVASKKLVAQKPGGMCQYVAPLNNVGDVDTEIVRALKRAFDAAG